MRPFASPSRTDWHFVPENDRKGLQLRDMNDRWEEAALRLVRSALSQADYEARETLLRGSRDAHQPGTCCGGGVDWAILQ